jgi:hypothetical protein
MKKKKYPDRLPCVNPDCHGNNLLLRRGQSFSRRYWLIRCESCNKNIAWDRGLISFLNYYYQKSPELIIILGEKNEE